MKEKVLLGIVFHATLEYYFTQKIKGLETGEKKLTEIFLKNFSSLAGDRNIIWEKTPEEPKQRGISFVNHFLSHLSPHINPLMVEKELEVGIDEIGVNLKGIIDLVEQDFSITDFKTTNSKWSQSRVKNSFLQMVIYKYLFEKSFGKVNSNLKLKILYSRNGQKTRHQEINLKPENIDMDKMLNIIQHVVDNIKNELFYKNKSYLCDFCEFKEICVSLM